MPEVPCATRVAIIGLVLLSGLPAPQKTGAITGRVFDSSKSPVPGAIVTARLLPRGPVRDTVSRADGSYELAGLPDGLYMVDATQERFDIARWNGVQVKDGAAAQADLALDVSAMCECVSVHRPGVPTILQGTVTDGRGHPLPHARLSLSGQDVSATANADAAGRFRAKVPENRVYVLTTAELGFMTQKTTIRVREASRGAMTVTIDMEVDELGDVPERDRLRQPCSCPGDVFIHARR